MPAQRHDDGAGPLHDLSVRRGAPRGDPAGLRGHRHPLRVRAAIRRQVGRRVDSVLGGGRPAGAARLALRRGRAVQGRRPAAPAARHRGVAARSASAADARARADEPGTLQRRHPRPSSRNCPTRKSVPVYTHIYEFARDDADRAADPQVGRRLADQLSQARRSADAAHEPGAQRVDDADGDRGDRGRRSQRGSQPGRQPENAQRRRAHPHLHAERASTLRSAATIAAAAIRRTCSRR